MRALLLALFLFAPVVHCQLPALPDSVPSVLGYVRVIKVPDLTCNERPAYGCYNASTRIIQIRDSLHIAMAWQTLFHELGHVNLHDASVQFLSEAAENQIVDVLATARLAMWLEQLRATAGPKKAR